MKEANGGVEQVEHTNTKLVKQALVNPLYILVGLVYFCCSFNVQSLAIFLPTVLNGLGYSVVESQLHSVYPNILGTGATMIIIYLSHWTQKTGLWVGVGFPIAATGFGMLLSHNLKVNYAGTFVASIGAFTGGILALGWNGKNSAPYTTRAVAMAMGPTLGHLGAIASAWAYRAKDAPHYKLGNAVNMSMAIAGFVINVFAVLYIVWENRQRAQGKRDYRLTGDNSVDEQLGSLHPRYRYKI